MLEYPALTPPASRQTPTKLHSPPSRRCFFDLDSLPLSPHPIPSFSHLTPPLSHIPDTRDQRIIRYQQLHQHIQCLLLPLQGTSTTSTSSWVLAVSTAIYQIFHTFSSIDKIVFSCAMHKDCYPDLVIESSSSASSSNAYVQIVPNSQCGKQYQEPGEEDGKENNDDDTWTMIMPLIEKNVDDWGEMERVLLGVLKFSSKSENIDFIDVDYVGMKAVVDMLVTVINWK